MYIRMIKARIDDNRVFFLGPWTLITADYDLGIVIVTSLCTVVTIMLKHTGTVSNKQRSDDRTTNLSRLIT